MSNGEPLPASIEDGNLTRIRGAGEFEIARRNCMQTIRAAFHRLAVSPRLDGRWAACMPSNYDQLCNDINRVITLWQFEPAGAETLLLEGFGGISARRVPSTASEVTCFIDGEKLSKGSEELLKLKSAYDAFCADTASLLLAGQIIQPLPLNLARFNLLERGRLMRIHPVNHRVMAEIFVLPRGAFIEGKTAKTRRFRRLRICGAISFDYATKRAKLVKALEGAEAHYAGIRERAALCEGGSADSVPDVSPTIKAALSFNSRVKRASRALLGGELNLASEVKGGQSAGGGGLLRRSRVSVVQKGPAEEAVVRFSKRKHLMTPLVSKPMRVGSSGDKSYFRLDTYVGGETWLPVSAPVVPVVPVVPVGVVRQGVMSELGPFVAGSDECGASQNVFMGVSKGMPGAMATIISEDERAFFEQWNKIPVSLSVPFDEFPDSGEMRLFEEL